MVASKRPVGWSLLVALTNGHTRISDERLAAAVHGKVVLVTGSSYGIGEATARRLAAAGATVLLVARTEEQLQVVADEIRTGGGSAYVYPANLADPGAVEELVRTVLAEHGRVDVLVNNAGKSIRRSIADTYQRFHDIERTNAVNYLGPAKLVLELLPSMRERQSGHIVNVSTAGVRTPPMARWSAYLASKSAFDVWLRCVAQEVRGDGVTTSTVYMGLVHTRMSEPTPLLNKLPGLSPEQAADQVCTAVAERPHNITPPFVRPADAMGNLLRVPTDRLLEQYFRRTGGGKRR
ncbi:NAD(P)-dependent dehydrogenase (short-subunit alcohol dehydrogenase family) [Kribbella aluminosa]|uniref:NAD(P)-dependent dehydrogenase (Short-subunit alcohol dehydrogenase family) n=1 Tax=Kribbella aluminosa TaxID=416017 RepID=A0ABS4UM61_9ACTN|nr:SDR family NAD(P)-dependent oxidoreductase [Kribbella aluminosa]MBP2352737.1 NAD(P)-dependent dehydrogenase (short-subunit alcohol dehydrogenase family) [Kribbella aluminosa]